MDMLTVHEWARTATVDELKQVNKICCDSSNIQKRQKYRIGNKIRFEATHGQIVSGIVERINKKTLSLRDCSDGQQWRVGYTNVI